MQIHEIAERVMDGRPVCPGEIWEHNATQIIQREAKRAANPHDPKGCNKKDCTHGQGSDVWYAQEMIQRAARDCVCGQHGK